MGRFGQPRYTTGLTLLAGAPWCSSWTFWTRPISSQIFSPRVCTRPTLSTCPLRFRWRSRVSRLFTRPPVTLWMEMEGVGEFYYIEDPNYWFAAFVFVAVVANIITWPLAYGIRSIPGFSQVL